MMRFVLSFLLLLASVSMGAKGDSTAVVHAVVAGVRPAFVTKAASAHLQYSFAFPEASALGRMFPTAYQGVGVASYSFFNHDEVGSPAALYVFQGATIARLGERLSLDYEWNFGVSAFWKPNADVSTRMNAYINAGLMLSWRPLPSWKFSAGLDYTHFSNGDTTFPNAGVNTYGARFTASRSFEGGSASGALADRAFGGRLWGTGLGESGFLSRASVDVILCGAWYEEMITYRRKERMVDGKFGVLALHVNPLYKVTRFLSVGPSVDVQFNEGINLQDHVAGVNPVTDVMKFHRPPLSEQLGVGLSARVELHAPIFSINLGLGHNVIYKGEELDGLYGIIALKTFLYEGFFLHTGLKVFGSTSSNNLLLGAGWRF